MWARTACGVIALWFAWPALCTAEEADRIVAVVDETPILESRLSEEIQIYSHDPSLENVPAGEIRAAALKKIVDDEILLAKARMEAVAPSEEDIEDALQTSLDRMRSQFPTEEAFQQALRSEGLTYLALSERYREEVEKTLTIRMLVEQEVRTQTDLSDADVRKFYDEHIDELPAFPPRFVLAQIFIEPDAAAAGESLAVEELRKIRERVDAGEDFADLARINSDGPSAANGGDLGFFGRGDMVPEFEDVAYALVDPGDVSEIIQTQFGFHIIQLVQKDGDRIRVRHILLSASAGQGERYQAQMTAEALRDSLIGGARFARLAETYSDDPASAAKGGLIGTFAIDDISPEVAAAVRDLPVEGISDVVEAEDGFHIFQLLARYEAGKPSFEEAREEIRMAAAQARQQEIYENYIDGLKEEIFVEIRE